MVLGVVYYKKGFNPAYQCDINVMQISLCYVFILYSWIL